MAQSLCALVTVTMIVTGVLPPREYPPVAHLPQILHTQIITLACQAALMTLLGDYLRLGHHASSITGI